MKSKKFKKTLSVMLLAVGVMTNIALSVQAYTAETQFEFFSGENAVGYVDGSSGVNQKYYSLNSGSSSLDVRSKSGSGTIYVTLKKDVWGIDPSYGTASVTGTNMYYFNPTSSSDKYYYYANGSNARTSYSLFGYTQQ